MSSFNKTVSPGQSTATKNLAGGSAYVQTAELEFLSIILTSLVEDQFYRKADQTLQRVKELIAVLPAEFVAKAAIYARKEFGMRSITHVVASELGPKISSKPWGTAFYDKIIHRVDDITEIIAYHLYKKEKLSNAMKRGFGEALGRFNEYAIAKYRGETNEIKLVDAVNLIHPRPTDTNREALKKLINGTLASSDTWESELSKAGQIEGTDAEKAEAKRAVWTNLLKEGKLGQFALLRNLRNIYQQAPNALPLALEQLVDPVAIKKSLMFPYRYYSAYKEIAQLGSDKNVRSMIVAISKAVDISMANVPVFAGETLVALDTSGSMQSAMSGKSKMLVSEVGALFAAMLVKASNADFMTFDYHAEYRRINPSDSTMTLVEQMRFPGGATNTPDVFVKANKKYDRIIILSDMQTWVVNSYGNSDQVKTAFTAYKRKYNANPLVYCFDLAGYGTMHLPEQNVYAMAGFSDKTLEVMKYLEEDKKALINTVNSVVL